MIDVELLEHFMRDYLPRRETSYHLPVSASIAEFWPALMNYRRERAVVLPLQSATGEDYWYVPTVKLIASGDKVAEKARREVASSKPYIQALANDSMLDEAYFSSLIEGAATTRQQAREFLKSGATPSDQSERMILNNYLALDYILRNLNEAIDEAFIIEIARILTDGTDEPARGYRTEGVQVVSGRQEIVYIAPPSEQVKPMMDQLLRFISVSEVHPVLKSCIAHVVFVSIHPFVDGNGRTARALSYMILLRAGYDFFRQFPISGLIAQERPRYYKAIRDTQSPENGFDLTYFLEYYTGMLAGSVDALDAQVERYQRLKELLSQLQSDTELPERIIDGAQWLIGSESKTVTAELWRKKFGISFETARKDLHRLECAGVVRLSIKGRKHLYEIIR